MPKDLLLEKLVSAKGASMLRVLILSAAVLKNCKESNMLCVGLQELRTLVRELGKTNLKLAILYRMQSKYLLLIYRKDSLDAYLSKAEVQSFLHSCGYTGHCLRDFLPLLRGRIAKARESGKDFPHEIGVFLGYPLCDIQGFLRSAGKDCLHCGYWKVYGDLDGSLAKFRQIDEAKNQALYEWLAGRSLCEIAC